jgi:Fic family protein
MGDVTRPFKPTLPDLLPAAIENACRWFDAESFIELNPIEQAALVFLRLAEFQPFESASDRTSLVAASLFTMRRELPPVIIKPESQPQFRDALDEGLKMNTKPMIELMAAAVESSLDEMIGIVERKRKETKG